MDKIELLDNVTLLRFAIDDLESLRLVIQDAVDREDGADGGYLLTVAALALQPIMKNLHEALDGISAALEDVGAAQKCRERSSEAG